MVYNYPIKRSFIAIQNCDELYSNFRQIFNSYFKIFLLNYFTFLIAWNRYLCNYFLMNMFATFRKLLYTTAITYDSQLRRRAKKIYNVCAVRKTWCLFICLFVYSLCPIFYRGFYSRIMQNIVMSYVKVLVELLCN